jgi:hypothetical protein
MGGHDRRKSPNLADKISPKKEPHLRESHSWAVILLPVVAAGAGLAHAQTNIQKSAALACGVMSGQRKADAQSLQLLLLTDEDASEGNPVAIALHREAVRQCPKAYLDYEQRKWMSNTFRAGSLVKRTRTQLLSSPSDYPIRCRGVHGVGVHRWEKSNR